MTRTLTEEDRHRRDLILLACAGKRRRLRRRNAVYAVLALLRGNR